MLEQPVKGVHRTMNMGSNLQDQLGEDGKMDQKTFLLLRYLVPRLRKGRSDAFSPRCAPERGGLLIFVATRQRGVGVELC